MIGDPTVFPPRQDPALPTVLDRLRRIKEGRETRSVAITDFSLKTIGHAQAMDRSHLDDAGLIEAFVRWRNQNRAGWLDQRPVTVAGTRRWLRGMLEAPDRFLYLLYWEGKLIGRTGLLDLGRRYFMTDGLIRGERGGGPEFIALANLALLAVDFDFMQVEEIHAKVLAGNELAMRSTDSFGYRTAGWVDLFRHEDAAGVYYEDHGSENQRVPSMRLAYRVLTREAFAEQQRHIMMRKGFAG